jgi:two-component system, cell cycle response regulator DivK
MPMAIIIIIEDDNDNQELVRILLNQAGFINFGAPDGPAGLELIRQHHPDLVLLDLTLPQIDGWHLARQIKSDPEMADIKIVALTAHALPGDRRRALEAGCDGYLTKPINIPTFIPELKSYLSNK